MDRSTLVPLENIAVELVRRGLPIDYSRRTSAEFVEHQRDLEAELCQCGLDEQAAILEASRRLGDSRTLVKKTVREYQRRFLCGRWRVTTFLLAPIPLLCLLWIATTVIYAALIVWPIDKLGLWRPSALPDGIVSTGGWVMTYLIQAWFLFVIPAVVMLGLAKLARRAAIGWRWIAMSACVVAFTACMAKCGFPAPELNHRYMDGTPVPADRFLFTLTFVAPGLSEVWWAWYRDQFGRILLPFVIAAAVFLRSRQLAFRSEQLVLGDC